MAISRMQMYRQLRAGGGIMDLAPREKFGLGSKLKKFVRNIIPNEVSEIAVKAAPFVAPFNPALAGAMAGIGSFDQTGRIGQSVKAGLINYGLGQGARYLGGAGFQGNPFTSGGAFTPSGFMSGFSSPFGTQTGIGKLLADKGFIGTKALPTDPGIATDSVFIQPGAEGTYTYSDFGADKIMLEPGSVTPSGQIVSGTAAQNQAVLDQIAKQTVPGVTENVVQKVTQRGYGDVFKDIFSGDLNKSTSALKELGGKALKSIYTNKDGSIDKLAIASTIAGGANYIEARKLAKEAELVGDEDEYTEEMYEADKQRYKDYYSQILTPEAFGLKDGGIISLRKMKATGSIPEEFISYTDDNSGVIYYDPEGNPITKAEAMKAFDEMPPEEQVLTDMEGKPLGEPKTRKRILPMPKPKEMVFEGRMKRLMEAKGMLEPESFEYLLQELKDEMTDSGIPSIKLEKKATGGRVGFSDGTPKKDSSEMGMMDPKKIKQAEQMIGMGMDFSTISSITGLSESILEQLMKTEKKADGGIMGGRVGFETGGNNKTKTYEDYEREERLAEFNSLVDKLMTEQGIQDRGYAFRLADDLINMKNKNIDTDRLKFLNEQSALFALPKDMRPEPEYYDALKALQKRVYEKEGGIINARGKYAMGSEVPIRQNEAGTKELDYRQSGGFVPPIGIKEKADDIPAMLSNNEFVFTADAVRGAGGGSVNKGAQKMYALMKQLEGKVV